MKRLRRLLALRPVDWNLLVQAWIRLLVVALGLRWFGYRRVAQWAPECPERSVHPSERRRAERYANWIAVAARRQPIPALCLAQSLALLTWLRREGVPCDLQIGVIKAETGLAAHAWVELDGTPINDTPRAVAEFTPLAGLDQLATDLAQRRAVGAAPALR